MNIMIDSPESHEILRYSIDHPDKQFRLRLILLGDCTPATQKGF